jgi:uncharacterized protein
MSLSRRHFLALAGGSGLLAGLSHLYHSPNASTRAIRGYGKLVADPQKIFDLPPGFSYQIISRSGGNIPSKFDGMAAFAGTKGGTVLIRNHELYPQDKTQILAPEELMYDPQSRGGTTTLVLDRQNRPVAEYISLAGTNVNCAGGKTPWNTWISCEENTTMPGDNDPPRSPVSKPHGYNFEVSPKAQGPRQPVPLVAMGRFRHEAICVDPRTGIVYQTEDHTSGAFYRFIPQKPGNLAAGGRLEALRIVDRPQAITKANFPVGQRFAVDWIPIEEPNPSQNTVSQEAFSKGAAQFCRGEGIALDRARGELYFTCTQGGTKLEPETRPNFEARGTGQIWRYRPGKTALDGGTLDLFLEPNDRGVLDLPDNIIVAPNGHILACEDGKGEQRLIGITPRGHTYVLGLNTRDFSELAGVCFGPDGRTMFVNLYDPGMTLAITGPWRTF